MTKVYILLFITAVIISCFHIDYAIATRHERRHGEKRLSTLRLSKRGELAMPDAFDAIKTGETGAMGALAVVQHTLDNELRLMQAKEASVPSRGGDSGSSEFGASTRDVVPAAIAGGSNNISKGGEMAATE